MEAKRFRGLGVALVTPFHEDGTPDLEGFARHVEFQVEGGVDFLVPCGTTGESATLDDAEQRTVIEAAVAAAAGRVPVVAGAGTNDTDHAARLARSARPECIRSSLAHPAGRPCLGPERRCGYRGLRPDRPQIGGQWRSRIMPGGPGALSGGRENLFPIHAVEVCPCRVANSRQPGRQFCRR